MTLATIAPTWLLALLALLLLAAAVQDATTMRISNPAVEIKLLRRIVPNPRF